MPAPDSAFSVQNTTYPWVVAATAGYVTVPGSLTATTGDSRGDLSSRPLVVTTRARMRVPAAELSSQTAITDGPAAASGTGLGLFVTRSTIEQLGGTFRLVTQPEAGTTVTMTLPIRVGR